jgi:translocation and assembly module TamB
VRVRYPEGVSTTLNGSLNLAGTATRSLLSGDITVLRSSISPRTDFAALLESASERLFTPPGENKLLQGMQFDIHVATAAGAKFETSLTSDVQAQASLRLRGSSAKPVLLGRISVTQGDINFFGNHYSINRGEITFVNPVKVEPVLDLNLETRSRGILIDITFSGTLNKLNVNYRSDPPLQSSEIIALLALGRAPASIPTVGGSPSIQSPSSLQGVPNSVLNQAMAGPATSRLQRLFGASRIKIDPTLTGVENIPEARLTMEQQISKDIVFTYITNLNKGQQQIVRVEWGFAKKWSVVAIREENGLFGVDLLYKRRF